MANRKTAKKHAKAKAEAIKAICSGCAEEGKGCRHVASVSPIFGCAHRKEAER